MRDVDQHLAACLAAVGPLPARPHDLLEAADLLLAEDVVAPFDLPRFDNSAMDGYAVRAADVSTATADRPLELPVAGEVRAGGPAEAVAVEPGTVVRIMTGAPVPAGADAIVPVEWTDGGTGRVIVRQPAEPGRFLRRAGEDVRAGEVVLRAGTRLGPRQVALLAAVGRPQVLARPRPLVVVLPSGDELVPPGEPLGSGRLYDSNGYGLVAAARELGAVAEHGGIVGDDPQTVTAAIEAAAARADLVITTGGVSAGAYDTVKEVLSRTGTVTFQKVAMQPGMPQGFGTVGPRATPIFTLPGNPVSALVSFEVFVRPVLRTLAGEDDVHRRGTRARAAVDWSSPAGKRQFVRAVLESGDGTVALVRPVGGQGSHLVADLAEASCLAVVPEEVTEVRAGDELQCLLLERGVR